MLNVIQNSPESVREMGKITGGLHLITDLSWDPSY